MTKDQLAELENKIAQSEQKIKKIWAQYEAESKERLRKAAQSCQEIKIRSRL